VRERTIGQLSERYQVDRLQALRVERCCQQFLSQVAKAWKLEGEENQLLLGWAAQLHEIGLAIAHSGYQKHGAYLLENSDMPGFSSTEQKRLAVLVRGHRRKLSAGLFKEFSDEQGESTLRLCLLLRLAVLLHRSHSSVELPAIQLLAKANTLQLIFPDEWLTLHPLTAADLSDEMQVFQGVRHELVVS
jgi:exopolyphosphatase/guanosine-5'-triphosphate,3'-diphosphate pyrophosphatase